MTSNLYHFTTVKISEYRFVIILTACVGTPVISVKVLVGDAVFFCQSEAKH